MPKHVTDALVGAFRPAFCNKEPCCIRKGSGMSGFGRCLSWDRGNGQIMAALLPPLRISLFKLVREGRINVASVRAAELGVVVDFTNDRLH